ncbi:zinc finger, CCHC-type containing protein [Tanacetum coccineum]|uniref:Zinc finger, CCHC-type containing protein n=1 Tax=Tanacetum coccineum TaxID=301880 RepID=A0ABQ5CSC7_9ASTR
MDFSEFYKELESEFWRAGAKLIGIQLLQLELRLAKIISRTATQTTNNNSIRTILEKEKLNGSNFLDWYCNLQIVLRNEQKLHHLEEALPEAPPVTSTAAVRNAYTRRVAEQQEVACLMLKPKSQARDKEKQRGKGKSKLAYDPKHKIPLPAKKEHPAKDTECHHYHKTGHWKRNCPLYLVELKKNKSSASGTSGAITIADEPGVQKGAKHFRRKYHFICEVIQEGDIRILKVHTDNNLADPLTKPMPCTKHVEHARSIRLKPAGSFM